MRMFAGRRLAVGFGVIALAAAVCLSAARAGVGPEPEEKPDPELKPTFGQVKLKAGFTPDPFKRELIAGGAIRTNLGGVNAYVAKAPDFKLFYTAGDFALTIHVDSPADTTLLINLPDGKWVAVDDAEGLNPVLKFETPQSGRYDIWVGTFGKENAKATLFITELK
jgi:hypothetical protein